MATFKLVIRPNKILSDGTAPVYIRITNNQKTSYKSTSINVKVSLFDAEGQKVKSTHQNSVRINHALSKKLGDAQKVYLELNESNSFVSASAVKDKLSGDSNAEFFAVANKLMIKYEAAGKIGTLDNVRGFTNKIQRFCKNAELPLKEINGAFLDKYSTYCKTLLKNKQNKIGRASCRERVCLYV